MGKDGAIYKKDANFPYEAFIGINRGNLRYEGEIVERAKPRPNWLGSVKTSSERPK